jgi:hypothetical protein
MKKIILFFLLGITSLTIKSQTSFSTDQTTVCRWDDVNEKFVDCLDYDVSTLIEMAENESLFIHTTNTIKSTYYIKSRQYNKETKVRTYDVVSDVGNYYTFFFDPEKYLIKCLSKDYLIIYRVKNVF